MTKREMNLNVFTGKKNPCVFFQPRIEPWFDYHKQRKTISPRLAAMDTLGFYDDLDVSMRYIHYYTGMPDPIEVKYSDKVKITNKTIEGKSMVIVMETPFGPLTEEHQWTQDNTWRETKFPVVSGADYDKATWLMQNTSYLFNQEKFDKGAANMGDRGEPQFWVPRSPYQAMCLNLSTLEDFIFAMTDMPDKVETLMKAIDDSYDSLYEQLARAKGLHIMNFGENVHAQLLSQAYFEKYFIPFYQKRVGQLRKAGIYTYAHFDGYFKPLLPYLKDLPFDGIEALTPLPQGDVSIDEMKAHLGDKILLDGIPAVFFMPYYKAEELEACVKKLVKLFHPKLVLGISDEFPQGAPEECLERVRWTKKYCENYTG